MPVKFSPTSLPGVLCCDLHVFGDRRGFFTETYRTTTYRDAGIAVDFVQDNFSHSGRGTLRGLHYQLKRPQAKLVTCLNGSIFDVAVDIRVGSPTFGQWTGEILSDENRRQFYIPEGFAHGFCVLSSTVDVIYKCSNFYDPSDEYGMRWDDPDLGIDWPVTDPVISDRDKALPQLRDIPPTNLPRHQES